MYIRSFISLFKLKNLNMQNVGKIETGHYKTKFWSKTYTYL